MAKRYNKALDLDSMKRAYYACFYKDYKTFDDYAKQFLSKDKKLSNEEAYDLLSDIQTELEKHHLDREYAGIGAIIDALHAGEINVVKINDGSHRRNRIFYHPRRRRPFSSRDGYSTLDIIDFEVDQYHSDSNSSMNMNYIDPLFAASKMVKLYKTIYVQIVDKEDDG